METALHTLLYEGLLYFRTYCHSSAVLLRSLSRFPEPAPPFPAVPAQVLQTHSLPQRKCTVPIQVLSDAPQTVLSQAVPAVRSQAALPLAEPGFPDIPAAAA